VRKIEVIAGTGYELTEPNGKKLVFDDGGRHPARQALAGNMNQMTGFSRKQ